jgi:DNA-binding NtrC family response regulator
MNESSPSRPPGVLLVDDEPFIRDVVSLALRRVGFTVLTAANGREAVDLFRSRRSDVDVVLLDMVMPGLDGPATLAELERVSPTVRCCLMSGGATPEGGHTRSIRKPFQMVELVRVLRELLQPEAAENREAVKE